MRPFKRIARKSTLSCTSEKKGYKVGNGELEGRGDGTLLLNVHHLEQ
jgi:hypothetical protein